MREKNIAILGCALGAALLFYGVLQGSAPRAISRTAVALSPFIAPPPPPPLTALTWREVPFVKIPWEARDSHAFAVFQDALWVMGGLDGNGLVTRGHDSYSVRYWEAPHFDDVWKSTNGYDWERITDHAPWGERRSIQAVEFKGKLWLMGGWGPEIGYRNDVWASTDGYSWELITNNGGWPAREGHSLVVWRNKLWLIGGVRYDIRKTYNDVWSSSDGIHWELATENAAWSTRWDHAVALYRDRLYLTAGMDLNGGIFKDVWVSDDGRNWTLMTDTPPWRARQGHILLDYKGKLWTLGVLNDVNAPGPNDVWFTEDGAAWKKTDVDPAWAGREDHGAVVWRDKIWITGGMDSNWHWNNDVWYSAFAD